nr:phosphotransferase [Corynebacterium atrinae]
MLEGARFYGAKSEPIDSIEVVREATIADGWRLQVLRVHHGGTSDLYQVLIDAADSDVFHLPEVIGAYGAALTGGSPAGFGVLHGTAEGLAGGGRAISGEQSNTSLIFGNNAMVKVFRHLEAGQNPDVELLSQIPESPHVAAVRGWVTENIDGEDHTLAMIQDFIPDADDGWRYALGFSSLDAHFGPEASLLGEATSAVHEALAQALPTETVPLSSLISALEDHLDQMLSRAPVLAEHEASVREVYRRLAESGGADETIQRIHGDLHLGQVLRNQDTYVLIDFEGEPARPLADRRRPDSPLRDVAGVIRSLDYAAHFPARSGQGAGPADPIAWAAEAAEAFLQGYQLEPSTLLDAYVLDKALYEVVYESNNRPDWVDIPLDAVRRLLGS